jgi:glucosylceramidase
MQRLNPDNTYENLGGFYNKTFNRFSFSTDHFSIYCIFQSDKNFDDINQTHWADKYITGLASKGIVQGTATNTFSPNSLLKREELVSMVVSGFNLLDLSSTCSFNDVLSSNWYYPFISSAVSRGIIKGYDSSTFGVGDYVKRQDAATIIANTLVKLNVLTNVPNPQSVVSNYSDHNSISGYAVPAVALLTKENILKGDVSGNFYPSSYITRAQFTSILYKALVLSSSQGLPYQKKIDFVDIM